jgi:gas vesicle protein
MRNVTNFLSGFTLGALIGVVVVLLYTPYSGDELRNRVQSEVGRIQSEVKQAAVDRRAELEGQLSALRQPRGPAEGLGN